MPTPTEPPPVAYRFRNFLSDLDGFSGADDWAYALVDGGSSNSHVTTTILSGATHVNHCHTDHEDSGDHLGSLKNSHWQAGDCTFSLDITAIGAGNVTIRNRAVRILSDGTEFDYGGIAEAQAWTSGQDITATGIYSWGPFHYSWGNGSINDRLGWEIEFVESGVGDEDIEIKRNDPDTTITVPIWWTNGKTPVTPGLAGFTPNRQTERRKRM